MARFVTIAAGQLGPVCEKRDQNRGGRAADGADAPGERQRLRPGRLSRTRADHVLPALVLRATGRHRCFLRARDARTGDATPCSTCARELGIGFYLGYAELARGEYHARFNTSILVDQSGAILGKYRKIHLPGHAEHEPWRRSSIWRSAISRPATGLACAAAFGASIGMAICNDRRWPETYRVMGLQGVEMVLLGYNTPVHNPPAPEHDDLSHFHNAGDAVRRLPERHLGGRRRQGRQRGGRRPDRQLDHRRAIGEIVAACTTNGDELALARCDLDLCNPTRPRPSISTFTASRRPTG